MFRAVSVPYNIVITEVWKRLGVSWMSLGMMVTLLAWMAHKFVSSKSPTRYASEASCDAPTLKIENASLLCGPV